MYEGEKNSSAGRNRLENLYSSYGILFWAEVARRESEKFQINLRLLHVHVSVRFPLAWGDLHKMKSRMGGGEAEDKTE